MRRWVLYTALFCLGNWPTLGLALTAEEIIRKADDVRAPGRAGQDFIWTVTITTLNAGQVTETSIMDVFIKGFNKVFIKFRAPAREVGRSALALDRDFWLYLPSAGKPVRLPLAQRLVGRVANGDVARINYAGDYTAELVGDETVDGQPCAVLALRANTKDVTYASIRYWVAQDTFRPVQAEFYTLSGKLLKTGYWDNMQPVNGTLRPMRLTLVDGLKADSRSLLEYTNVRLQALPEKLFNKNAMKQFE